MLDLRIACSDLQRNLQAIVPPTSHQTSYNAQEPPDHGLELDHVHGYRAHDSRHNLLYTSDGRVVYPAGTCGVVQDPRTSEQSFFCGHEDDVLSLTMHPDGDTVATGSAGAEAAVCIWSASSGQLRAEIRGFHRRGVVALSFDSTGDRLATCGLDDQNSIAVYDWATQRLASSAPSPGRVFAAGFSPVGSRLVTGGVGHLCFWMVAGGAMTPCDAEYGPSGAGSTVTALGWLPDGSAVTGTSTGMLYHWQAESETCLWSCAAHNGPVFDICFTGDVLVSAGKDGRVLVWAPTMQRVDCVDLRAVAAQQLDAAGRPVGGSAGRTPAIRSLCASPDGTRLLVGTAAGEAWELDVRAPGSWRIGPLLLFAVHGFCHAPGGRPPTPRACGLAAHPCELAFATVGDDATLRQWDCVLRTCTMRRQLPSPGLAVAYAPPDGGVLAVGLADGRLLLLDAVTAQQLHSASNRRDALAVLAFSPSGRWLAAGCDDNSIDLCAIGLASATKIELTQCVRPCSSAQVRHQGRCVSRGDLRWPFCSHNAPGLVCRWSVPAVECL